MSFADAGRDFDSHGKGTRLEEEDRIKEEFEHAGCLKTVIMVFHSVLAVKLAVTRLAITVSPIGCLLDALWTFWRRLKKKERKTRNPRGADVGTKDASRTHIDTDRFFMILPLVGLLIVAQVDHSCPSIGRASQESIDRRT